jgi:hypothetical protein
MGASVWEKHAVMIYEQPATVTEHAKAVVTYPVKQDYCGTICLGGAKKPAAENGSILCGGAGIANINFIFDGIQPDLVFIRRRKRAAPGMSCHFAQPHTSEKCSSGV